MLSGSATISSDLPLLALPLLFIEILDLSLTATTSSTAAVKDIEDIESLFA